MKYRDLLTKILQVWLVLFVLLLYHDSTGVQLCLLPKAFAAEIGGTTYTSDTTLSGVNENNGTVTVNIPGVLINSGILTNNGTLTNTYWMGNFGTLTNYGTLTTNYEFYNHSGATLTNSDTLIVSGYLTNQIRATIANSGTLTNSGTLPNAGTLTNSGTLINPGNVHNTGTLSNSGMLSSSGTLTNYSGATLINSGTLTNSGTFNMTGGTFTVGAFNNSGTFNVSGGSLVLASGTTVGRNLGITTLSGSARFYINTNLAGNASDLITVTGSASGSHYVYVTNIGAPGTGQIVKVVDLSGGSTATFSGGGDKGAYNYGVASGASLSSSYSSLNSEDYYFYCAGPSTVSRTAMGQAAGMTTLWYGEMNEIRKRMGELRMGSQSSNDFWVRGYASKFSVRPAGADSFSQNMRGFELGKDNPQKMANGKKYTGFVIGSGRADNTYNGGTGTTDSNYLGAYASWVHDDGAYVDLIGKYNWFSPRFTTASDSGSYNNKGFGLSAEIGRRFERKNGVFFEPAAELSAFWARHASYTTTNGLAVEVPASRSLQLRLGVTAGQKWQDTDGTSRQFYGKVAWVKEFAGDSSTRVETASFDSSLKGHQWVTGIGYIQDTANYQLYLDAEKSWGSTVSKDWGLNVGCRFKF